MKDYKFDYRVLSIVGINEALFGMGLSHGLTSHEDFNLLKYRGTNCLDIAENIRADELYNKLVSRAKKLYPLDKGHNKFLKFINVYLDITAPRYWWQDFDTYGVGVSRQSESTMHTLDKCELTQDDFVINIPNETLQCLNHEIYKYQCLKKTCKDDEELNEAFEVLKNMIPEGFLQRRIVVSSVMALKNICEQRKYHRLRAFKILCKVIQNDVLYMWES